MTTDDNNLLDLSSFNVRDSADSGREMHLSGPNGERLQTKEGDPITITLLGADSKPFQRLQHKQTTNRLNKRVSRGGRIKITGEELEEDAMDILVACTKSWKNIVYEGQELECNAINIRMLYERLPWIREQVDEFINDRSNFLGN